jgi:hypothetical protein
LTVLAASAPAAPTDLVVKTDTLDASMSNIMITWTKPFNGGKIITGYHVFIKRASSSEYLDATHNCQDSIENHCSIPISVLRDAPFGYKWGQEIYVEVKAVNRIGESEPTEAHDAVILSKPDAPFGLYSDSSITDTSKISIAWYNGRSDGGHPIIDYRVSMADSDGLIEILDSDVKTKAYTTTQEILGGHTYRFVVEERTDLGYSPVSEELSVMAATAPDPPRDLHIDKSESTDVLITLKWEDGLSDGYSQVLDYTVYYNLQQGDRWQIYVQGEILK